MEDSVNNIMNASFASDASALWASSSVKEPSVSSKQKSSKHAREEAEEESEVPRKKHRHCIERTDCSQMLVKFESMRKSSLRHDTITTD